MSSHSISFTSQIITHAKAHGTDLTRQEIESLSATINSVARVDESNQVAFDLGRGPVATLDQAIAMFSAGMGRPAAVKTTTLAIPENASATERAILKNQAVKAGADTAKREQAESLVRTYGNPWKTGNATHKAFISNVAPEMATQLKKEAKAQL